MEQKVGDFELNKIYCMDCLEGLKKLPDNSIDLVLTDPPYGIDYKSNHGSDDYKDRIHNHDWDKEFNFGIFIDEIIRVTKDNSYIYVWGRHENIRLMQFLGCDRILIWDKQHNGMGDLNDWGIGFELIFVFKKGKPKLRGSRVNGVIPYKHIGFFDKTLHPTQKPKEMIKYIISKSSDNKNIVLDCFMGSGTTAVACKELGRNFIGFEISQEYCDIANKRLQQEVLNV